MQEFQKPDLWVECTAHGL